MHQPEPILSTPPVDFPTGDSIGLSREGRAVHAFRFGRGARRVSLLAGCHADEPVGPRLLRHLAAYLGTLPGDDPLLSEHEWWIVPHINPDGAERNRPWQQEGAEAYDLGEYLASAVRELPGDDIEFGFPRDGGDRDARPENRAVYDWWRGADGPFSLHVSLHGMAFAAGPWFLVEEAWRDRYDRLREICLGRVDELGYTLHDVERRGAKGFFRLERGFCTRPDSRYMREHFLNQDDPETARLFRPSSMETIRSLGGDPLTLVSEMPLFITPGVGERLGPPDPAAEEWKARIENWKAELEAGARAAEVTAAAQAHGLRPMPARDQMILQWTFIAAGLDQIRALDS
ncbi:MAG: peptidase [Gemmatimonadota bacterium]|nr:MAG: peptidase [Gemmatimonadota bacterium]